MATDVRTPTAPGGNYWSGTNTTDFRGWCQAVDAAILAVGMVATADTGQIDLTTTSAPTVPDQSMGYKIYRFNDTLQATAPVFIKLEFGSAPAYANYACVYITLGTGTNGAGTITGTAMSRRQLPIINTTGGPAGAQPLWTSGASNRLNFVLCRGGTFSAGNMFFGVERTKDGTGADTGEGLIWAYRYEPYGASAGQTPVWVCGVTIFSLGPGTDLSGPACMASNQGSAVDGVNTGLFAWNVSSKRGPENPPIGWVTYFFGDFTGGLTIPVSVYNASHTYRTLGADSGQANTMGVQRAGWRPSSSTVAVVASDTLHLAMRWE